MAVAGPPRMGAVNGLEVCPEGGTTDLQEAHGDRSRLARGGTESSMMNTLSLRGPAATGHRSTEVGGVNSCPSSLGSQ